LHELASASEKIDCFDVQDLPSRVKKGDAIIAFGFDLVARCAGNTMVKANGIPIIAIDFKRTPTTDLARVVLPPAIPGIDAGGVATRLDGTAVLLHPPLQQVEGKKTDADILRMLHERT
jgi:formylmethanofuran dehydrogenase subunit B